MTRALRLSPRSPLLLLRAAGFFGSLALLLLLVLPFLVLLFSVTPSAIVAATKSELFLPALVLSIRTSLTSLVVIVLLATPLSLWLSRATGRVSQLVDVLVQLPIVIPPAVVGIALLRAFGRQGALGPALADVGLALPFTDKAVIMAQVVVASPFYIQAATGAFRNIDEDLLVVARTLGATKAEAFFKVALPLSMPGLIVGASLAFARSLGEFGATLVFAGNLPGQTQTMPLAILTALEVDMQLSVVLAFVLALFGGLVLVVLRRFSVSSGPSSPEGLEDAG